MKKAFKFLSILLIIGAVLVMLLGIGALVLGILSSDIISTTEDDKLIGLAAIIGVFGLLGGGALILLGLFDLITGIFGVRGANGTPKCAGRAKVLAIIALILSIATNLIFIVNIGADASTIISAVLSIAYQLLYVYAAYRVQHEEISLNA